MVDNFQPIKRVMSVRHFYLLMLLDALGKTDIKGIMNSGHSPFSNKRNLSSALKILHKQKLISLTKKGISYQIEIKSQGNVVVCQFNNYWYAIRGLKFSKISFKTKEVEK